MDWLNETPVYTVVAPQLLWIKVLEICAGVLLVLSVLTFIAGWERHLSWRVRLWALVPLVAGIASGISAHVLHDTYMYWVYLLNTVFSPHFPHPLQSVLGTLLHEIAKANHTATLLGWILVIVTGILLALSFLGVWRLVASGRWRPVPTSVASQS